MRAFQPVSASSAQADGARAPVPPARLLDGVVPAASRRWWSLLLDGVAVLAVGAGAAVLLAVTHGPPVATGVVTGVVVLAVVAVLVLDRHRSGQSLGHRLLGLRTVDRRTALPHLGARRHAVSADLRSGRDPLHLVPGPAAAVTDRDRWALGDGVQVASRLVLVAGDGFTHRVERSTIIGRNPANPPGTDHHLVGVTDLSRTMSKSHALLEPQSDVLWVTDLASTNGTAVARPGAAFERIPPRTRVSVTAGSRIAFGDRVMTVSESTVASAASRRLGATA